MIHHGDLFDVLPTLLSDSVDACVTDPPYGIGFMGREWDTFRPGTGKHRKLMYPRERIANEKIVSENPNIHGRTRSPALSPSQIDYDSSAAGLRRFQEWTERWAGEVFRVMKPGAHLVVCGAPRSFHRMTCGLEDAGFDIRDCFSWLFGSGFPKSLNIGSGHGTALKPAWEPIVLARKPFKASVRENVEQYGTGVLGIDACRIGDSVESWPESRAYSRHDPGSPVKQTQDTGPAPCGRWPSNVLLDKEAAAQLDEQTGELVSGFMGAGTRRTRVSRRSR